MVWVEEIGELIVEKCRMDSGQGRWCRLIWELAAAVQLFFVKTDGCTEIHVTRQLLSMHV
jgi:hypothetical protein